MKKVIFIASAGGHLNELLQLEPLFKEYDYHIVTEKIKVTTSLKLKYNDKISFLPFGSRHKLFIYFFKFTYCIIKSFIIYIKIKPSAIVTTGTHTAVPLCLIAKLFGKRIIFIETFANQSTRTLSGRIIYPIADVFIVQWEDMIKLYPKAIYGGWIY